MGLYECLCGCKELHVWSSYKDDYMWNPSTCDCECSKIYKTDEELDIRNYSCKKRLFGKLVLPREDEILNTIKASLVDKK